MVIKILGGGCKACKVLFKNSEKAVAKLGIDADIQKVEDFDVIGKYGVMSTPALVVDEKIMSQGEVLSAKKITEMLKTKV